ncbi:MAG: NUDIX hydrolase [Clostridia bacterium]|nr:NUDIX hydrolase [Clostridia bacterium]
MIFEERVLESEMIYEGAILNLRKDKVTVPNGTSYREIVEHNGGAVVVAITDDHKVVMVKQYRAAVKRVVLELPAGKVEDGEDPMETAIRELKEETGYTAGKTVHLISSYPSIGYTEEMLHIYLCTELVPGETDFDENEALDIYEYDYKELMEMIRTGELLDGKSQLGLLMAGLVIGSSL